MTLTEITDYINTNWPEITDANHAAQMVSGMQDKHCIDTILGFYVRYI
tara:strand:+ start:1578 stop:1721 length:144 start_codon:yes stop_codon:yes gene_type:complete